MPASGRGFAFAKQGNKIKCAAYGVAQGRGWRYEWVGGRREKVRGVYRFSSLVKQNKKAKICFVIHIAGERIFFFIFVM